MSDEMMVQNSRPSAMPYLLGGAAIGGAAGALQPWVGVKKQKYASFDDIIKEKKDSFETNQKKAKKDDVKSAYDTIIKERNTYDEAVKNAETERQTIMSDTANAKWNDAVKTEGEAFENAQKATEKAKKDLIDDIKNKIKNGDIEVDDLKKDDAAKAEDKVLQEKAEKYFADNESKLTEDASKVKDKANALKTAKEAEKTAKEALEKAATDKNVKAEKELTEAGKKAIEGVESKIKTAKENASKAVEKAIKEIKTPNKLVNGIIGGVGLALLATLLRPKAKDDAVA